jgi:cyclic pyranopterin monophosphate synthase
MKKPSSVTLPHLNQSGHAHMVDVGSKPETERTAIAQAYLNVSAETLKLLKQGKTKKGDVLATARIAAIAGAKVTAQLIPLCHPLPLTSTSVAITVDKGGIDVRVTCKSVGRTGVEMEALTSASIAALTLYDMLKAHDKAMHFDVRLLSKAGGRTGDWKRP